MDMEVERPKGLVKYYRQHEETLFGDLISLKIKAQREGESLKEPREAMIVEACGVTFKGVEFKPWIQRTKFDLVIIDSPMNECGMAVSLKFKAPFMFYTASGSLEPWQAEVFGIQDEQLPEMVDGIAKTPNILDRLMQNLSPVWSYYVRAYYLLPKLEKISKKWLELPTIPSFTQLEKNASLVLHNGHISIEAAKQLPSFLIPIGGMRCSSSKEILSDDLAKFLDEKGQDGFIYINFGTMVDFYKAPDMVVTKFFDALRNVNMPILWKWGSKAVPANAPENVFFASWIPQNAVLSHTKLKVFIYHGGPLSTQEAIYHGVPVIVFPLTIEGERQAKIVEHFGIGIKLDVALFTQYEFTTTIRNILKDNSFRKKAIKLSALYKDRSQDPKVTAVWWIEYVLRHQGAYSLKPQSTYLHWYQRRLLDAWALVILSIVIGITVFIKIFKFFSRAKPKPTQMPAQGKKQHSFLKNKDKLS
ncbi:unnamed protein product [Orchesella dallaii]|uniref:UDP-glucuronosyltransferase n=1 Tax=Orchesella dallaii TaxID=48710 RepID=A0ABP1QEY4_9HEXA